MFKCLKIFFISTLLLLTSCTSLQTYIAKTTGLQAAKEKEIAALKLDYENKLQENTKEITATLNKIIEAKNGQIKGAVNGLYAANMVFDTIITPTRTDIVTNNYVNESWSALDHQMPDYDTLLLINKRVKDELDETKTSLEDLKKNHNAVMQENQKLVQSVTLAEKKLKDLLAEQEKIKNDFNAALQKKTDELVAINLKNRELQTQIDENNKELKEIKTKFSTVLGIIALACIAAAIWSPVFKEKFGLAGILSGGGSVAIWFIQPWMVGAFIGACLLALVGWAAYKYHISDRANTAFINFVNDKKQQAKDVFDQHFADDLNSWLTKYKKNKDGTVTTVPDQAAINLIQSKLEQSDRLDPTSPIIPSK